VCPLSTHDYLRVWTCVHVCGPRCMQWGRTVWADPCTSEDLCTSEDYTSGTCSSNCPSRRSWTNGVVCDNLIEIFYNIRHKHTALYFVETVRKYKKYFRSWPIKLLPAHSFLQHIYGLWSNWKQRSSIRRPRKPNPRTKHEVDQMTPFKHIAICFFSK